MNICQLLTLIRNRTVFVVTRWSVYHRGGHQDFQGRCSHQIKGSFSQWPGKRLKVFQKLGAMSQTYAEHTIGYVQIFFSIV